MPTTALDSLRGLVGQPIFSNSQHKVVVDTSVDAFHQKFKSAYAGKDISLFYGVAP